MIYPEVGKKIHTARKENRITQFELSQMLGITFSDMSRLEHGHRLPTSEEVLKLEKILDIKIEAKESAE